MDHEAKPERADAGTTSGASSLCQAFAHETARVMGHVAPVALAALAVVSD